MWNGPDFCLGNQIGCVAIEWDEFIGWDRCWGKNAEFTLVMCWIFRCPWDRLIFFSLFQFWRLNFWLIFFFADRLIYSWNQSYQFFNSENKQKIISFLLYVNVIGLILSKTTYFIPPSQSFGIVLFVHPVPPWIRCNLSKRGKNQRECSGFLPGILKNSANAGRHWQSGGKVIAVGLWEMAFYMFKLGRSK